MPDDLLYWGQGSDDEYVLAVINPTNIYRFSNSLGIFVSIISK